jgi:hypothetical protein
MFMQDAFRFARHAAPVAPHAALAPRLAGIIAGTLVETVAGWRPVETLCRGDLVQTLDGGLRPVVALGRGRISPTEVRALVHLPGGLFSAAADMWLLPGQPLLIDTWDMPDLTQAPRALVPARALKAIGAAIRPLTRPVEVISPVFADEEVIWANSGLLLHCPGTGQPLATAPEQGFFPLLDGATAQAILLRSGHALAA